MSSQLRIMITTRDNAAHVGATKFVNYNSTSDRQWLLNHLLWAVNNNHEVTIRRAH